MKTEDLLRMFCLAIAVVLALSLVGCGGDEAESDSSSEVASEPAADAGDPADVTQTDDKDLEFDDVPEIAGYEILEQNQGATELYVTLRGDVSEEQALQDITNWAESDGWTALDVDWPTIDLAFEKPNRVYPLKISVSTSGGILLIMPAVGDKLGDW